MLSSAILDVHCVLDGAAKFMIKEMSVVDIDTYATQHWIFKHSHLTQNAKSRSVNKWLERNYHKLSLEYGDVEYTEINHILNSLTFDVIYVKGEQKQKIIKDIVPYANIINIEEIGCPRLNQVCDEETMPCCIFHKDLNPKQCTFFKVFALKQWFINNYQ